jgi:hypothetical protein
MKSRALISVIALVASLPSAAWAATVTGRITYLDPNGHHVMLNNSDMYALSPDVGPTGLEVGRLVTVNVTNHDNEKIITKVLKHT